MMGNPFYVKRRACTIAFFDKRRMPSAANLLPTSVFGRRLRQAREAAGKPQDRLGVEAGLDEASASARMSRYESGAHEPKFVMALQLAKALRIPVAYLYCDDDVLAELILEVAKMSGPERHAHLVDLRSNAAVAKSKK